MCARETSRTSTFTGGPAPRAIVPADGAPGCTGDQRVYVTNPCPSQVRRIPGRGRGVDWVGMSKSAWSPLEIAHREVRTDPWRSSTRRAWLVCVFPRQGVVCCCKQVSTHLRFPLTPFLGALTLFADAYAFPVMIWRGERCNALRDDEFLYASRKSSVEYAVGPDGGLEKC